MSAKFFEKNFSKGALGIQWAFKQINAWSWGLKGGTLNDKPVSFDLLKYKNADSFKIALEKDSIKISANSVTSFIAAAKELNKQVQKNSFKTVQNTLQFQTRFYKFEVEIDPPASKGKSLPFYKEYITKLTPEFLHKLFQEISLKGFNAIIIYSGYHPFEYFLDYKGFEHGTDSKTKAHREKNLKAVQQFYNLAKSYGLKTFLHHYVSHFSQELADHLKLGIKEGGTRLANYDHPEIDKYNKYLYKRTFELIPDLDGLLFNFESAGNASKFMQRTVVPAWNAMKKKPIMYIRLWGISDSKGVKDVFNAYKGPKGMMHKSHDTNDVYYYPVADDRVKIWRKEIPGVEFAFSMGPCHNCATNLSAKLWTDPEYIHKLMKDMQDKGATSVSFQATSDLLVDFTDKENLFKQTMHDHSRNNIGHLLAFEDYIQNQKPDQKTWVKRYAENFNISEEASKYLTQAILNSSQVILKHKWQFCGGSYQEGHLYNKRNSNFQEPFFYYPMSFLNELFKVKYNLSMGTWLKRDKPMNVVPNDTQYIIDFVNPKVKKTKLNPQAISDSIKENIKHAAEGLKNYKKLAGKKVSKPLVEKIKENINWGQRAWRELEIGIELYKCFFSRNKNDFFKNLKATASLLADTCKNVDAKKSDRFMNMNGSGPFIPEKNLLDIQEIVSHEKEDFPWEALKHFVESHRLYNELRRYTRPFSSVRNEVIVFNRKLLIESLKMADKAIEILEEPKYNFYRSNVLNWKLYVQSEIDDLIPPAMACYQASETDASANYQKFRHDQCYRYGENCWEAFSSFFAPQNFFRQDNIDFKVTYSNKGLHLSLREHGINWQEREEMWEKNKGTINQTGFLQIFLDCNNDAKILKQYTLFFYGEGGTEQTTVSDPKLKHKEKKKSPLKNYQSKFEHTDSWWQYELTLPWSNFDKKPKPGDIWKLNAFSNPAVKLNHRGIWCQGYEMQGDTARLGQIVFK